MTPRAHRTAGFALIVVGGLAFGVLGQESLAGQLAALVTIAGIFVYFRGRQKAAKALAESAGSPIRDSKPDVLYLRSFEADTATTFKILMSGFTTEEEQLADVLRPFGDLIAIGRPGERLPAPGAIRTYAADSDWKDVILNRMRSAPLVVIRAGVGDGLLWEVGQARSVLSPARVLLLVLNLSPREYRAFADRVRDQFGLALPRLDRAGVLRVLADFHVFKPIRVMPGFIMFSDDWTPVFLPLPLAFVRLGYNDLRKPLSLALRPVFERHGLVWHRVGRFRDRPAH